MRYSSGSRLSLYTNAPPSTKFFSALVIALLFFSVVQYSVLAVDRSRSLYIFSWVDQGLISQKNGIVRVKSIEPDPGSLSDLPAVSQRVHEQVQRGLMSDSNEVIELTFSGKLVLAVSNLFAKVFNLTGWYSHT